MVSSDNAQVSIVSNTIRESPTGIKISGGQPTITNNDIYGNGIGADVETSRGGKMAADDWEAPVGFAQKPNGIDIYMKFDASALSFTIGDGNSFGASNFYIVNDSPQNIDFSTFTNTQFDIFTNGAAHIIKPRLLVPANTLDLGNLYALEDRVIDHLDQPASGFIKMQLTNVFVSQLSENTTPDAIQRGVEVCDDGNNLYVQAGTFDGSITVSKGLTLLGAQAGNPGTARESSAPSVSEIVVTKSTDRAISITGGHVTVDGFDIVSSVSLLPAVQVSGGTATLENNVIEAGGVGVQVDQGAAAGWWIKANYIYMKYDAASSGYAIKMGGGSLDGQITSNDIRGNGGGGGGGGGGIYMVSSDNAQVSIVSNTIRESPTGIKIGQGAYKSLSIQNNLFTQNATGLLFTSSVTLDAGGSVHVNNNSISGNTVAGLENDSTTAFVDASSNWWGDSNGPSNPANVNATTGDKVIDPTVGFAPWLTSGANAVPAGQPGFVPASSAQAIDISGPSSTSQGATYTLDLEPSDPEPSDPGSPIVTAWDINWGDGTVANPDIQHVSGNPTTVTHVYAAGGNFVISAVATTASGPATSNTLSVSVFGPPTVDLSQSATSVNEASTYTLVFGVSTDPGQNNILGYAINWGDGAISDFSSAGTPTGTVTHVYDDGPATRNIRVTLFDPNGAHPNAGAVNVSVLNVAPTATIENDFPEVSEGDGGLVKLKSPFDPSSADGTAGFTYSFSITNTHGTFLLQTGASSSVSIAGTYLDTPGTDSVSATISDRDGGIGEYSTNIIVDNVAPAVNHVANFSVGAGVAWTQAGSLVDPGNDAPWLVYVNYDAINHPGLGSLLQSGPGKTFTLGTTYAATGTFTVQVTVQDLNGIAPPSLSGSTSFQVQVNPTAFHVTNFAAQASGFDVQFNRAASLTMLNLYSGLSGVYGPPDVTLVGATTGPVSGSLVWNPTTNTASFIKTGGVLAPDTYTVTLVSGSSAWQDTSNSLLDGSGSGSGGNYVTSFTVGAVNDVVSLPDFARGPRQTVSFTTSPSIGLPVSIANGAGVTAVDFTIAYNPNLLTISAADLAAGLPSGWSVTQNNTPGLLQVSISGPTALGAGARTLLNITCTVPAGAGYAASGALRITNLRINEGAIAGTADEAVEKVALIGNASGTGIYDPFDAHLISNVVVHNATGFDAFPLTDPTIVADVTGDGTLSGQDASLVLQQSVGLPVSQIPPVPAGFVPPGSPPPAGADPQVSVPSNVLANPGGSMTLPITIDDASQLQSSLLQFTVDPSKLTLTNATLGAIDSANWSIIFNPANGKVAISNNGNTALPSGQAVIENLIFSVASNAVSGSTPVTIASGDLNGGSLPLTTVPGSVDIETPSVAGEFVFYNNSKFDGNNPAANPTSDFAAVATDKTPLLPGGTAAFGNYTSYSHGLNGILIDLAKLAPGIVLSAADFQFKVGNNSTPAGWATAPAPASVVMGTDPGNGNSAVDLVWPDNSIQNQWLQVTVLANSNNHLASNVVFYFGNAIGETGNSTTDARVDSADLVGTFNNETGFGVAGITNHYDINRDGRVDSADMVTVFNNESGFSPLLLISVPPSQAALPVVVAAPIFASPVVVATGTVIPTTSTSTSSSTAVTVVSKPPSTPPKAPVAKKVPKFTPVPPPAPNPPKVENVPLFGTQKILKPVLTTTKLTGGQSK
jgi:hypothetical protein